MDALVAETSTRIQSVQIGLADLERATSTQIATNVSAELTNQLDGIAKSCVSLEHFVGREPPQRRRDAKYRLDQLLYDHTHLTAALHALQQKVAMKFREQNEREELFSRRYTANDSTSISIGEANVEQNARLRGAHGGIDDMLAQGAATLENLRDQRMSLKDIKRKTINVLNQLGMSNTVMQFIERRSAEDMLILCGGMVLTVVVMVLVYWGFKT